MMRTCVFASYDPLPAVRDAIKGRRGHKGYMAEYKFAYALVRKAIGEGKEPMFASWFYDYVEGSLRFSTSLMIVAVSIRRSRSLVLLNS